MSPPCRRALLDPKTGKPVLRFPYTGGGATVIIGTRGDPGSDAALLSFGPGEQQVFGNVGLMVGTGGRSCDAVPFRWKVK